jgi:hypothetical protein
VDPELVEPGRLDGGYPYALTEWGGSERSAFGCREDEPVVWDEPESGGELVGEECERLLGNGSTDQPSHDKPASTRLSIPRYDPVSPDTSDTPRRVLPPGPLHRQSHLQRRPGLQRTIESIEAARQRRAAEHTRSRQRRNLGL